MKKLNVSIIIISIILILGLNTAYATNTASTRSSSNITNESAETNELSEEEIKEQRANKNLTSLEVKGYTMSPYFNKNNLAYTVIIPEDVTSIEINAEPEVEGAIVRISGNTKLTKQENSVTVRVTAQNGTSKVYTITVLKAPKVNLKLNSLQIEGLELNPVFDENTFYYTSSLVDTELTSLNVNAVANDETANVEVTGANNLIDGENLINIIISNDDETTIYQVNVDVDMLGEKEKEVDNVITRVRKIINYSLWGVAGFLLFIVLILIIVFVNKIAKKRKNDKEYEFLEEDYNKKQRKRKTAKRPKH